MLVKKPIIYFVLSQKKMANFRLIKKMTNMNGVFTPLKMLIFTTL